MQKSKFWGASVCSFLSRNISNKSLGVISWAESNLRTWQRRRVGHHCMLHLVLFRCRNFAVQSICGVQVFVHTSSAVESHSFDANLHCQVIV